MDPSVGLVLVVLGFGAVAVFRMWRHDRKPAEKVFVAVPQLELRNQTSRELSADMLAPGAREAAFLKALRDHDPEFHPDQLRDRVWRVCTETRQARSGGDTTLLRALVTDGLLHPLLARHEAGSAREHLLTTAVGAEAAVITDVETSGPMQAVRVRLTAFAPSGQLVTVWTLARSTSAKTCATGLLQGKCPSCGAPFTFNAQARCSHCDVIVNSGVDDWVVTSFADANDTQRWSELVFDPDGLLSGRDDPGLSRFFIEERAHFAFWRWQRTLELRSAQPLAGAATEDFTLHLAPALQHAERYVDVDLRRVSLVALHTHAEHQVAIVEALWTAATPSGRETVRLAVELRRKAGARTARPLGVSSARCGACLGPQVEDAGARCSWCGSEMPDAWYLVGLAPYAMAGATRARTHGREQLYLLLLGIALADGEVSPEEQRVLDSLAKQWGYEPPPREELLRSKAFVKASHLATASDDAQLLRSFARRVALADGVVTEAETAALNTLNAVLDRQAEDREAKNRPDSRRGIHRLME